MSHRIAHWLCCLFICGCSAPQSSKGDSTAVGRQRAFAAPEGIAAHDRWILVANTAFHFADGEPAWGSGFVTLIDRHSGQVRARIATSQPNPTEIVVVGDRAYVVNTGTFDVDEEGLVTASSAGGIDIVDLSGTSAPVAMSRNIPLPTTERDRRIGSFGSIAISPDAHWAYVGSGTRGDVFKVDLSKGAVVRGADNPIELFPTAPGKNGLTTVRRLGSQLAVLNFNTDELCTSAQWDNDLDRRRCYGIGVSQDFIEGPLDLAAAPDGSALVLMTLANAVYRIDTRPSPFATGGAFASTGLSNNRLAVQGPNAYVVNSMSNNLQRIALNDGHSDLPFATFALRSNPYGLALTNEHRGFVGWVTLFQSNQVARVDLNSGKVLQTIEFLPAANATEADGSGVSRDGGLPNGSTDAMACQPDSNPTPVGITNVVSVTYGEGAGHGQANMPQVVQQGPFGGGSGFGSVDSVLSLGTGGEIIVDFGEHEVIDGPGPDLIVFENPFGSSPDNVFAEPAIVGLSAEGSKRDDFTDFDCQDTRPYRGCAGVSPVLANLRTNCIRADDPRTAGGDAFDLADVGLRSARYLRIRDAGNSKMGDTTRGFDLDAVVLVNYR